MIVVDAHVGAVQHLHVLAIDASWRDAQGVPARSAGLGGSGGKAHPSRAAAEVVEQGIGYVGRHRLGLASLDADAERGGDVAELRLVGDAVARGLAPRHLREHLEDVPAVVGVRRGARSDGAPEVAGDDHVGIGTAYALGRPFAEGVDTAGTHGAVAAAHAKLAVAALRLLGGEPIPHGLDADLGGPIDHPLGILVDAEPARPAAVARGHRVLPPSPVAHRPDVNRPHLPLRLKGRALAPRARR